MLDKLNQVGIIIVAGMVGCARLDGLRCRFSSL
jgi:hypothetical protein